MNATSLRQVTWPRGFLSSFCYLSEKAVMASQTQIVTGNKENHRNYTCRVLEKLQSIRLIKLLATFLFTSTVQLLK